MLLQFVSPPPSQNQPLCSVTTTRNSSEHENRNRTGYTLEMLHNRKSQRCIRWLFLMNTRTDTVPIFRGNGTGSWRHNRVAGALIELLILRLKYLVAYSGPGCGGCTADSIPVLPLHRVPRCDFLREQLAINQNGELKVYRTMNAQLSHDSMLLFP